DVDLDSGLVPALLACWASCWSDRVLAYQHWRGLRLGGMGVIVQQQIGPAFAGVLFTANPDRSSGSADDLLVEYCPGHAEALVQGRIDPERVLIARADLRVRPLGGPAPLAAPTGALVDLARASLALEAAFGRPQDVEWALDADARLWLVQARPIT